MSNSGTALLMEMGTGKTITAIAIAGRGYLNKKIKKALVICPTSVMAVWEKELQEFADFKFSAEVLDGTMAQRNKKLLALNKKEGLLFGIINYEATWRMADELQKWNADLIICDESQRIKNPTAKQSKCVHKFGDLARYKLILSGTPVQNSPLDIFSQYRFLDSSIFGNSFYSFRNKYARMGGYGGYQIIAYNNIDELIKKAHSIAYRVTKAEALDLPEQVFTNRYCYLDPTARKIYDQIKEENYIELEKGEISTTNVLTRLLRLSQITGGFVNNDAGAEEFVSDAKLIALEEIIEDTVESAGKKLVIFARFTAEITAIKKLIEKHKIQYRWIAGDVPMDERGPMVKDFQEDEAVKIFIAQIQTAGLGITLTASDTAVFYSLDFNFANYSQATARIHRIGQKNNCTYIHLLCKNTVDEKIMKALSKKEDIAKNIVDNWRKYFTDED
jgi:SNF2 family DNA or RNA helicase